MEDAFLTQNKISTTVRIADLKQLINTGSLVMFKEVLKLVTKISPEYAAEIAWSKFCTPRYSSRLREPFNRFQSVDRIKVGDDLIKVFRFGGIERPTVCLVHGWTGRASDFTEFVDPLLKAGYRVVAFDAPGHGESAGNQTNAIHVARVIHDLQEMEGPFHAIIGHSFGGFAASIAASQYQSLRKIKLITIGSPNSLQKIIDEFSEFLSLSEEVKGIIEKNIEEKFGIKVSKVKTSQFINQSEVDGLIIHDKEDRMVSYQEKVDMVDQIINGSHLDTEGLGHTRILFNEDVISRIIEFLINKEELTNLTKEIH